MLYFFLLFNVYLGTFFLYKYVSTYHHIFVECDFRMSNYIVMAILYFLFLIPSLMIIAYKYVFNYNEFIELCIESQKESSVRKQISKLKEITDIFN